MMAIPQLKVWTYDDYAALPDDGTRYEVIAGELIALSSPRTRHQMIVTEITMQLYIFARASQLGTVLVAPTDVVLSPFDVVQPDVLFIAAEHAEIITEMNVQGPPDLCVEILSPGTSGRDLRQKRDLYARFGVREYWIVDPDTEHVTVLVLHNGTYTAIAEVTGTAEVRSVVLSDFTIAAERLFPRT